MKFFRDLFYFLLDNFRQLLFLFLAPIILFAIHLVMLMVFDIYDIYPAVDIPMHFFGGATMALAVILLLKSLEKSGVISKIQKLIDVYIVFTTVSTIAIFWEFGEFLLDFVLDTNHQPSPADTMADVFLGMLGCVVVLLFFKKINTQVRLKTKGFIDKIL